MIISVAERLADGEAPYQIEPRSTSAGPRGAQRPDADRPPNARSPREPQQSCSSEAARPERARARGGLSASTHMEDIEHPGDLQKPRDACGNVHQREHPSGIHERPGAREQKCQAGRIDEPHMRAVDQHAPRPAIDERVNLVAQGGHRRDIDVAWRSKYGYVVPFTHTEMVPRRTKPYTVAAACGGSAS